MAWQLDRDLYGPERPTVRDIEPLNRVFSESFTDRYRRDGLLGVRVPHLNPLIWRYALEDAGEGAMVWRDGDGELVGFNVVHFSGSEGWMGPLAVRPDRQGIGLGEGDDPDPASIGCARRRCRPSVSRPCLAPSRTSGSTAGWDSCPDISPSR